MQVGLVAIAQFRGASLCGYYWQWMVREWGLVLSPVPKKRQKMERKKKRQEAENERRTKEKKRNRKERDTR